MIPGGWKVTSGSKTMTAGRWKMAREAERWAREVATVLRDAGQRVRKAAK